MDVHFSSKKMDWETPPDLFNELDKEFDFQWDLAASDDNRKCDHFIFSESLETDWLNLRIGLSKSDPWEFERRREYGWLWLNPPYGRELKHWVKKCDEESQRGAKIVALLPARTDTSYFHDHIYNKYEIRFLKGRVKFLNNGEQKDAAPFPSMIVIFKK